MDKTWKAFERWVGKEIFNGARRNIGSGSINSTDDNNPRYGDVIHDKFNIECKCMKSIHLHKLFSEGQNDFLISISPQKTELITMHYKDFIKWKENKELKVMIADACIKKRNSIFRWWDKTEEEGKITNKIPLLITRQKGDRKNVLVTMAVKDYDEKKLKKKGEYQNEDFNIRIIPKI